jgi:hypothetical protein
MLVKVSKKRVVRKMKQTGRIVRHAVGGASNVVVCGEIAVMSLMKTVKAKEVGGRAVRRDGSFATANDSREIIIEQGKSVFAHIGEGRENILVTKDASQFEVAVGNGASHVRGGDDVVLNVEGERLSPDAAAAIGQEPHAAHTAARGVAGAYKRGRIRNDFGEAGRAGGDGMSEFFKVVQVVADGR